MKTNQDNIISELTKNFVHADENIDAYEDFLSSWQYFADQQKSEETVLQEEYQSIEKFAVSRISRLVEKNEASTGYTSSPLFNSLHNSAVICNINGIVFDANNQAQKTYDLSKGMMLDNLNLRLESGLNISAMLRKLLMASSSESNLSLLQFYPSGRDADETSIPVIIMRLHDKADALPQALIVFMGEACNAETLKLLASKFGLTKAETDVIEAFSEGMGLKEIAKSRCRSYPTIRNQFQSALEKTGCSNQADLLRMFLGISYLLSYTEMISTDQEIELGKKIEVMRPHGRFVDVRLYGDLTGKPFITLHSLFGMPITEEIEKKLISRSLLMIGIFRPGFSFTSKPYNKEDSFQCLADDITAVLDNINVEQCPFIGRASAARSIFKLSHLIPQRISAALVVNSLVPLPYVTKNKILSKWTMSLVSASQYSPSLAALILATGKKLMLRSGARSFLKKMYKKSISDQKTTDKSGVVESIHQGVLLCSEQGMAAAAQDMLDGFKDWSDDVKKSPLKVSLFQGQTDPNVSIVASRHFANDFPDKVELVEFKGGGLLNYSHTDTILDWLHAECLKTKNRQKKTA